jgi:acetylglutamate kinase
VRLLCKIGGTLVDNADQASELTAGIAEAARSHEVAVVHGGGKQLTRFLEERGIQTEFLNGLRVTTTETIDAVIKVLAGSVNKQLVGSFCRAGANAVGISGMDGGLTTAEPISEQLGRVGRVVRADAALLDALIGGGFLPVVACVSGDLNGRAYNINADRMASALASAFRADRLFYLTDVAGVLDANGALIPRLTTTAAGALIASSVAKGGMQAKLEAASEAVEGGVGSVVIAAGGAPGILQRLLAGEGAGTELVAGAREEANA